MRIVAEEPVSFLGPGIREAMADPAHFRMTPAACVDYGPRYDEVPRRPELQPRRRWWQRLIRTDA